MKTKTILLLIIAFAFFQSGKTVDASGKTARIRFHVTVLSVGTNREELSKTTIDGPAGTDFTINLDTGGFVMRSRFLTDLVDENKLLVRVDLETRRLFGESPNRLPLYEEDKRNQSFRIRFDESLVLLPFGRNTGGESLIIRIEPERYDVPAGDENAGRLKIDFPKTLEIGEISIEARKVPHDYHIDGILLFEGRPVARGSSAAMLLKKTRMRITPDGSGPGTTIAKKLDLDVSIDKYEASRPMELVSISFDLSNETGDRITLGRGINGLGRDFRYRLDEDLGEGYELVIRVTRGKSNGD